MTHYKNTIFRIVPLLGLCLLLGACQGTPKSTTPHWDSKDPSCRVSGMVYMCKRHCRAGEVGPSGQACQDHDAAEGTYCDCGTR